MNAKALIIWLIVGAVAVGLLAWLSKVVAMG
jgi:hypothetical protein